MYIFRRGGQDEIVRRERLSPTSCAAQHFTNLQSSPHIRHGFIVPCRFRMGRNLLVPENGAIDS